MKKIIIASLCLMLGVQVAKAQNSISGTVVDKKGVPVHGALVEVKGSSEKVTTDFDGSFTIEMPRHAKKLSAKYVGLNTKVKKAKDGMEIRLAKSNFWNRAPERGGWFISAQCLFPEKETFECPVPGLMVGYAKNFGFYVKGFWRPVKGDYEEGDIWITGKVDHSYYGASLGLVARLKGPIYAYGGFLAIDSEASFETPTGWKRKSVETELVGGDFGLMLNYQHLLVNVGAMYVVSDQDKLEKAKYEYKNNFMINIGIGYRF